MWEIILGVLILATIVVVPIALFCINNREFLREWGTLLVLFISFVAFIVGTPLLGSVLFFCGMLYDNSGLCLAGVVIWGIFITYIWLRHGNEF